MSTADIRIVPVERVGDATRLEPLARAIFGEGQRPRGWFSQKLTRECVSPSRSILLTQSRDASDPAAWVGYGLLGRPPSLGPLARTAGIGLIPTWRRRGLGLHLLEGLQDAARDDGAQGLLIPASPGTVPFYARCGLSRHHTAHTLWATGTGKETVSGAPEPWESPCPGPLRSGWFAETWERTASRRRQTLRLRGGTERFDVSIEGNAQLAVRWTSEAGGADGPSAWLLAVAHGTPALLHDIDACAPELPLLLERGWSVAQTTITMLRAWSSTPG
ncbi:MAG: GNAT family N-acetyltransferase [Nannocystaceae bacterium]|nr:GNAT family N-acetyltransferase [Nannocystaceae bacterium]